MEDRLFAEYKILIKWRCPRCGKEKQQRIYNWRIKHYWDHLTCDCGCQLLIQQGFGYETPISKDKFENDDKKVI